MPPEQTEGDYRMEDMNAFYNEFEPYSAQWLRNLIAADHLPRGLVDGRSITEITDDDLEGFTQVHLFAGIGGWPLALRLAGWPDEREVWTGSCPCQPFSVAGLGRALLDERHLWPAMFGLIESRRPVAIFGEQTSSPSALAWLDLVSSDLEAKDYSFGACIAPAACFGGFHLRQRIYWMAHTNESGSTRDESRVGIEAAQPLQLANQYSGDCSSLQPLAYSNSQCSKRSLQQRGGQHAQQRSPALRSGVEWVEFRDGKRRPLEPGAAPTTAPFPTRVDQLRAYGNAIDIAQATAFVKASIEVIEASRN